MLLNQEDIKKIIPHRDPMLLIDSVEAMEAEQTIVCKFYVDPAREIFKGHFPGDPVLPGVYTCEIMAQASDILMCSTERYKGKVPLFLGLNNVKFKSKIKPGDTLEIHSKLASERAEKAIVTLEAEVYDAGVLACTGEIILAMR